MSKKRTQAELIKQLSNKELLANVYLSQGLFLIGAYVLGLFLFSHWTDFWSLFSFNISELVWLGVVPGVIIVFIDLVMIKYLPKDLYDDGGINQRLFTSISIPHIVVLTFVVAVAEEVLFRGIIQTHFGFWIASILFALVHIRYLRKWVLLLSVVLLSFGMGYLYYVTNNLVVTITAHYTIDLLLGIYYKQKMR